MHEGISADGEPGTKLSIKGGCFGEKLGHGDLNLGTAIHLWTKRAVVPIPDDAQSFEDDGPPEL